MTKLIINADDFGYCEAVNYGIISAYKKGALKSTTMMANMPGFEHGISLLKENPGLNCGVHMVLSCGKPVLKNLKTIVKEDGVFFRPINNEILEHMDLDEIYKEFCAQIDKIILSGVNISHIDSHHHVHRLKNMKPVIDKILDKYKLPIRGGFEEGTNYDKAVPVLDTFYKENVSSDYFLKNINEIKKHEVLDLMVHPAFLDDIIINATSYSVGRTKEYRILVDDKLKEYFRLNYISISSYKDV